MGESANQIQRHIDALSSFEVEYQEFISALEDERKGGQPRWSEEEAAKRKRAIQKNSVRADQAMKASGVGQWALTHPPAAGGGLKSQDLPSQVFDFQSFGFRDDGLRFQRQILERIPAQLAGLEVMLEEAEKSESDKLPKRPRSKEGRRWPTVVGRIRHVPPFIALVADVGGFVVVVGFLGRLVGVW